MSIAICEFKNIAIRYEIGRMQTSSEIRRARLKMLEQSHGGLAELNEALGWARTDPKLSQIKNNNKRPGRDATYQMGDAMAREIEEKLGLERGWMDNPPTYTELLSNQDDPRTKVMALMEAIPPDQWATAVRLLDALAQPAPIKSNGTTGSSTH